MDVHHPKNGTYRYWSHSHLQLPQPHLPPVPPPARPAFGPAPPAPPADAAVRAHTWDELGRREGRDEGMEMEPRLSNVDLLDLRQICWTINKWSIIYIYPRYVWMIYFLSQICWTDYQQMIEVSLQVWRDGDDAGLSYRWFYCWYSLGDQKKPSTNHLGKLAQILWTRNPPTIFAPLCRMIISWFSH